MLVIEKYKSGFLPPGDIPFEDLSTVERGSGVGSTTTPQNTPSEKKTSILGTITGGITGGKIKKRSDLLGIFGQKKVSTVDHLQGQDWVLRLGIRCLRKWKIYHKLS